MLLGVRRFVPTLPSPPSLLSAGEYGADEIVHGEAR
jgi:hypothetical protein